MKRLLKGADILAWENEGILKVEGSVAKTDENLGHTKIFTAQMEF